VDVVTQVVDGGELLPEGVPVVLGVGVLDAGLVEEVLVVEDRQRVEVLRDPVDLAVYREDVHEAGDEGAGVYEVRDGQDLAGGDDAGRGLTGDVEDVRRR